jgi:GNAT superfamily N-acetyltransferase
MRIVRLTPADDAMLVSMLRTFRGPDDVLDPAFLADPTSVAFAAVDGDDVLGWAWGHRSSRPEGGQTLLLQELEQTEAARATGAGRALVDAFVGEARSLGLNGMWLFTHAGVEAARRIDPRAGDPPGPRSGFWWVFE